MTLKKTLALVVAGMMTATGIANAHVYTVVGGSGSGNWASPLTWTSPTGTTWPVAGDTAIINNASYTVIVAANDGADILTMSAGTLTINSTRTLTIDNTATISGGTANVSGTMTMPSGQISNGQFNVNGVVELDSGTFEVDGGFVDVKAGGLFRMKGSTPRLEIEVANGFRLTQSSSVLEIVTSASIGGSNSGSLRGDHNDAAIVINVDNDDDVVLTLESGETIHGALTFRKDGGAGAAKLNNQGQIKADLNAGVLLIADSLDDVLDVTGSCGPANSPWAVLCGSTLRWDMQPSPLDGYFYIAGQLYIDAFITLETDGPYTFDNSAPECASYGGDGTFDPNSGTCP